MTITGAILVGASERHGEASFEGFDARTWEPLTPAFAQAGDKDVADACALAEAAYPVFSQLDLETRARFLETVADRIADIGDALIERAMAESGLPRARLEGERGRTTGQLRLFAEVVRRGDWLDVTIDTAMPDRAPLPRPDMRRCNVGLGPVAVFGASNFPLAFSVAGGDTASALAAGCPVVVKGHPAHPGTGELVARAVRAAVAECGLPEGVFSYLPGTTNALGGAIVADPRIKAVGFTGSRGGGLALVKIASERAEPIPVYAEMSSVNPVVLFPAAAEARAEALGTAFVQSLTMGAGQFCTNPGIVIALEGPGLDRFLAAAEAALSQSAAQPMLTPGIHDAYTKGVARLEANPAVARVASGVVGDGINQAHGALFVTDAASFLADPSLSHEIFGASSIVVRTQTLAEVAELVRGIEGQLTTTLLIDPADEADAAALVPLLAGCSGRVLANGWPTGVEVSWAMVHGGPFPATSDGRSTSVGALAIDRFLRPVCYQNLPDKLLPMPLRADNPWKLSRRIDGVIVQP